MNNFTEFNLDSNICKAITLCGYTKPTPVQAKSIPEVLSGRDVVVSAQTGTGKTAAFVLPSLHNLSLQEPSKKTRVLILTPTRELASQITKAAALYGKFMRFNIVSLVGGMPYHNQIKDLARGADIIVATPGRLMDHMEQKRIDLSHVEMLVLDEADRMLDMGFIDDVQYIAKLTPSKRQTLLFSATLDNKLMNAVKHLLKNPVRIDLSQEKIASPQIHQEMYKANNMHHKTRLLKHFLSDENIYKAIIFSATKRNADNLADELRNDGFAAAALHGDLRQNVRNRTLDQLRRGKIQYLVATDVAARGIDISDITHVFNYDLPRFCEDYVHRIGRTGRAGKTGIAISFVSSADMHHLKSIERYTGQRIKLLHQDIDTSSNEISTLKKSERSFDDEQPRKKPKSERKDDFRHGKRFSSERKEKGERGERKFDFDKSERKFKPKGDRKFNSDRSESSERKFKEKRDKKFTSDRSESPERKFKSRRDDKFKSEKPRSEKKFKSKRDENFRSDDRIEKKTKINRDEREFKSGKGESPVRVEFKEAYRSKSKTSGKKERWTHADKKHRDKKNNQREFKKRERDY